MVEVKADLWKYPCYWICIPTNGIVKESGEAVMGAGVAKQAVQKVWDAPFSLGDKIKKHGNIVQEIGKFTRDNYVPRAPENCYQLDQVVVTLFAFPTKHHYKDPSDLKLVETSCQQLLLKYNTIVSMNRWQHPRKYVPIICLPEVGCGLGGLDWEIQVQPICKKYFKSNDFVICHI